MENIQTSNPYYEEILQLRASFQRMNVMHRIFGEDLELVKKDCDRLWGITAKREEHLDAIEHNSMRVRKYLELAVVLAAQRREDNEKSVDSSAAIEITSITATVTNTHEHYNDNIIDNTRTNCDHFTSHSVNSS